MNGNTIIIILRNGDVYTYNNVIIDNIINDNYKGYNHIDIISITIINL